MSKSEKAIQILIDFVEGKMDISTFKAEFDNNKEIKDTLADDSLFRETVARHIEYYMHGRKQENIISYLQSRNWASRGDQLNIWGEIQWFLLRYNYSFTPTKYYDDRYGFLLDIQPRWVDITDEDFLVNNIVNKIPAELKSKSQKIKWCKDRIRELFRYDKTTPRWIQGADWPIMNGRPLVFREQKGSKGSEKVLYYFYNPDNGMEKVITQMY